jgi:hypothetical protein
MRYRPCILILLACCCLNAALAQDSPSLSDKIFSFPDKLLAHIQKKSDRFEERLTTQTEKYLQRLAKQERRLQKKLAKTDSVKAKELFGNSQAQYQQLQQQLNNTSGKLNKFNNLYSGHLDSMQTALHFLDQNKLLTTLPKGSAQVQELLKSYKGLQEKFNQTADIKKYLDERKQFLKNQLQQAGLTKEFRKYQQEIYYYKAQLEEYKNAFDDPEKLEAKLMQAVNKIPSFRYFFGKYSQLAALFPKPDNYGTVQSLAGLQTRADVQDLIQNQIASGGPNAQAIVQQNLSAAQSQLNQLKDRVNKLGNAGADMDMPDFKPNTQRTKTFLQRLEYSTNIQTQKSNYYFPTTTDMAVTAGYKLNEKSVIGIGASYKMGWGKDIQHIALSSQGIGFRSYADMKMKGSFYASGGFEYNYQKPFNSLQQIYSLNTWNQSGLIGVSKIVSLKTKMFKKTKVQLLWDFLSYQQRPVTQPLKFRVGYSF